MVPRLQAIIRHTLVSSSEHLLEDVKSGLMTSLELWIEHDDLLVWTFTVVKEECSLTDDEVGRFTEYCHHFDRVGDFNSNLIDVSWQTIEVKNRDGELVEEWWWDLMEEAPFASKRNTDGWKYKTRKGYAKFENRNREERNKIDGGWSDEDPDIFD